MQTQLGGWVPANAANPNAATPMVGTKTGRHAQCRCARATGGDFVMQSNGWLTNQGVLQATGNAQITTAEAVTNSATVYGLLPVAICHNHPQINAKDRGRKINVIKSVAAMRTQSFAPPYCEI